MEKSKTQVRLKEKISFLSVNIGNIPIMTLANSFLLIFYTDTVGLKPEAVGTLFLISRILDGVSDPLMGFVIDRMPMTKYGKFRVILVIGTVVCSINFLLLWLGPALASASVKLFVAYISYLCIGVTFDIMDISLNSLIPAMTTELKERNVLSTLKGIGYSIGGGIFSLGAPLLLDAYHSSLEAYVILISGATAIVVLFSIGGAIGIKERVKYTKENSYTLKELFRFLILGPVLATFAAQIINNTSGAISATSVVFYAKYIFNDLTIITKSLIIGGIGVIPILLLNSRLVERYGKRKLFTFAMMISGLSLIVRLFSIRSVLLLYISSGLSSIGGGLYMVLIYGIQADNIDYVEYATGKRAEGAISSLSSFITKVANGLGGAIPAYLLAYMGYRANQPQMPRAETGIILSAVVIPAVLSITAALIFFLTYKLDVENLNRINKEIKKRRTEIGASDKA